MVMAYNAIEKLIAKSNPTLAQKMYEQRTGAKTTTTTPTKTTTPTTPTIITGGSSGSKSTTPSSTPTTTPTVETQKVIKTVTVGGRTFEIREMPDVAYGSTHYTAVYENGKRVYSGESTDPDYWVKTLNEEFGGQPKQPTETIISNVPASELTLTPGVTHANIPVLTGSEIAGSTLSALEKANVNITSQPLIDTGPVTQGTATPEQLMAQPNWSEKVENVAMTEGEVKGKELGKEYYVGKSETGEPIYTTKTEELVLYGMQPGGGSQYSSIIGDISASEDIAKTNIGIRESNIRYLQGIDIPKTQELLTGAESDLESILKMKPGEKITLISGGVETEYDRDVAAQKYRDYISGLKTQLEDVGKLAKEQAGLTKAQKELSDIVGTAGTIERYKNLGYIVEKTDAGYTFRSPTTHETFEYVYGANRPDILTGAELSTDFLGLGTIGRSFQYLVTGDEKIKESQIAGLERSALDISKGKALSGNVFEAIVKSPAVQTGVLFLGMEVGTPLVLSGISSVSSKGMQLIYSGSGKVSTAIVEYSKGLSPVGSKIFESVVKTGSEITSAGKYILGETGASVAKVAGTKVGQALIVGEMFTVMEGPHLAETAIKHPEDIGGALGQAVGGWTVAGLAINEGMSNWYRPTAMPVKPRGLVAGETRPYTAVERFVERPKPFKMTGIGNIDLRVPNMSEDFVKGTNKLLGIEEAPPEYFPKTTRQTGIGDTEKGPFKDWAISDAYTKTQTNKWAEIAGKGEKNPPVFPAKTTEQNILKLKENKVKFFDRNVPPTLEREPVDIKLIKTKQTQDLLSTRTGIGIGEKPPLNFKRTKFPEYYKGAKEAGLPEGPLNISKGKATILKETGGYPKAEARGISTINRPLTEEEIKILSVAERGIGGVSDYWKGSIGRIGGLGGVGEKLKEITIQRQNLLTGTKKVSGLDYTGETASTLEKKNIGELGTISVTGLSSKLGTEDITGQVQEPIQEQKFDLSSRQDLGFDLESVSLTDTLTIGDLTRPIETTKKILLPPPIILKGKEEAERRKEKQKKGEETSYDVLVKERSMYHGKITRPTRFVKINRQPLTEAGAMALGGQVADTTSAISFKLRRTQGKAQTGTARRFEAIKHKFTKKGEVWIEKPEYRIDTEGEKKGISALGWQSNKFKGQINKLKGLKANLFGGSGLNKTNMLGSTKTGNINIKLGLKNKKKEKGGKRVKYL